MILRYSDIVRSLVFIDKKKRVLFLLISLFLSPMVFAFKGMYSGTKIISGQFHLNNVTYSQYRNFAVSAGYEYHPNSEYSLGTNISLQNNSINANSYFNKYQLESYFQYQIPSDFLIDPFVFYAKIPLCVAYSNLKGLDTNDYLIKNYKGLNYGIGLGFESTLQWDANNIFGLSYTQYYTLLENQKLIFGTLSLTYRRIINY